MKKIGLVTFFSDNFGSILQCYSTKSFIEQAGYECIVIDYIVETKCKKSTTIENKIKGISQLIRNGASDPSYFRRWVRYRKQSGGLTEHTNDLMRKFVSDYIHPQAFSWEQLSEIGKSDEYVAFIVGSDQVWNFNNEVSPLYGLEFAPKEKRVAFSVSLGVEKTNRRFLNHLKHNLSLFDKLSVREKTAQEIIYKVSDKEVYQLSDPTVLIDKNAWERIINADDKTGKDYLLVHFLNHPSDLAINSIRKYQETHNQQVVCIGYYYEIFEKMEWDFVDCDPFGYIGYIDNAAAVFTDSFHTTLFSINLNKRVAVFDRMYMHGFLQTSRITNLLKTYGMQDCFIRTDKAEIPEANDCKEILDSEREKIKKYLKESIMVRG